MSLVRYLPIPSERMAVMWTLLTVSDAIVLEYGPAGTTHFSMGLFGSMGIEPNNTLFTTHMSEDDVIMGDVTRLEQSIVELDKGYSPRVIFVIASAITAVIGTDLVGVCRYMQPQVRARLIALDEGGFKGDYTLGLRDSFLLLARELTESAAEKQQSTYNILGASAGSYRIRSDLWELQDLMQRAFGFRQSACFGLDASVDRLISAGQAQLNLVLRAEALPCAQLLQDKCGIPYIYGSPYGYEGTLEWVKLVGQALDTTPDADFMAGLEKKSRQAAQYRMYSMMYKNKPRASILGDYDVVIGLAGLCQQIGIPVDHMICSHSLKNIADPSPNIVHYKREKDFLDVFKSLHRQLLLADDVSLHVAPKDNTGLCVSFPYIRSPQVATHLPLMGERGTDYILETVKRYFQTLA